MENKLALEPTMYIMCILPIRVEIKNLIVSPRYSMILLAVALLYVR
jgi:hypothetical protein